MKNSLKAWIISTAFATIPLNISGNNFENSNKNLRNEEINTSLFENLNNSNPNIIWNQESINIVNVNPQIINNAVMQYFDKEVKMFKLSPETKNKINIILSNYLSNHCILKIWRDWNLIFIIDDKKAFSLMVKDFVNVVIDDMPFLVRKIIIPLFLGSHDTIQQKLDNLDSTLYNMKEKQYKDVIFDNIGGIAKKVAISIQWDMKIGNFYNNVNNYYPNQNSNNIKAELNKLWLKDQDIKNLKYPFK